MGIWPDLRYAVRALRKSPAFTAVAVLSLALGIGANAAIFSLINSVLLRDLPVRDPETLVAVTATTPEGRESHLSVPMLEEIDRAQHVFSGMFAWWGGGVFTVNADGTLFHAEIWAVTGNFYDELGTKPAIGRLLEPRDSPLDSAPPRVAVLGYGFWQRQFGGDGSVLGKQMTVGGVPFTVIGVAPRDFTGMGIESEPDVTVPLLAEPAITGQPLQAALTRDHLWLTVAGRLKPGATVEQARAQLQALWPAIKKSMIPPTRTGRRLADFLAMGLRVESAATGNQYSSLRYRFTRPMYILLAIAGLVLLIACVNLASLMLARASGRSHEMGVRLALGASRWRITRQHLIEAMVLTFAGSAAGLLFAEWASRALLDFLATTALTPVVLDVSPDLRVVGFAAALACVTGLLCGLAPSWHASRIDPARLTPGQTRTVGRGTGAFGKGLIVTQIALSLVLVAGAGLFIGSLIRLRDIDPGFRVRNVLDVELAPIPHADARLNTAAYDQQLIRTVSALPGVRTATLTTLQPIVLAHFPQTISAASGEGNAGDTLQATADIVSPEFFSVMNLRMIKGRNFTWRDDADAPAVAIVSQSLARRLAQNGDAIGRHVNIDTMQMGTIHGINDLQIVGIVSNARLPDIASTDTLAIYVPFAQVPAYTRLAITMLVWTSARPDTLARPVGRAVESLGHHFPLRTRTLSELEDQTLTQQRLTAMLSAFFGGLALLLAAIGLYGLLSYSVTRRTREIGIQMALGASRQKVVGAIMRETFWLALLGVAIGIPCALAATRLIAGMLFGLSAGDPATFAGVVLILLAVAAVAGYLPARRAALVDPMIALREE